MSVAKAIQVAKEAHNGQSRKYTGEDYILHPMRVMNAVALDPVFGGDDDMLCAAVLHDVLEDCYGKEISFGTVDTQLIYSMFDIEVGSMVDELTNRFTKENYPDLNRRRRKELEWKRLSGISDKGKVIKLYDRTDNLKDFFRVPPSLDPCFETAEDWILSEPDMRGFGRLYAQESWHLMMAIWDNPNFAHIGSQLTEQCARLRDACKP